MKIGPGDLVKIDFKKHISPENLMLAPTDSNSSITLYEKIDLNTYPSWKDFIGYSKKFRDETMLVIRKKGRPASFNSEEMWHIYDVYCLLHSGKTFECFSYCLEKIINDQP
jgi:hypothetical protein